MHDGEHNSFGQQAGLRHGVRVMELRRILPNDAAFNPMEAQPVMAIDEASIKVLRQDDAAGIQYLLQPDQIDLDPPNLMLDPCRTQVHHNRPGTGIPCAPINHRHVMICNDVPRRNAEIHPNASIYTHAQDHATRIIDRSALSDIEKTF